MGTAGPPPISAPLFWALVASWFLFSLQFNMASKRELGASLAAGGVSAAADATRITFFMFFWSAVTLPVVLVVFCRAAVREALPQLSDPAWWRAIVPGGLLFMLGVLTTTQSMARVSVGLTHIIKTTEPLFAVVLSWMLLGRRPTRAVLGALTLCIGGTCLVIAGSVEVDALGILFAIAANVFLQARNVLSKMRQRGGGAGAAASVDAGVLAACWSLVGCGGAFLIGGMEAMLVPEIPAASIVHDASGARRWFLWPGLYFAAYNITSLLCLSYLSAVMHAAFNCSKRGFIYFGSALVFLLPVAPLQFFGVIIALGGVYLTNMAEKSNAAESSHHLTKDADAAVVEASAAVSLLKAPSSPEPPSRGEPGEDSGMTELETHIAGGLAHRTTTTSAHLAHTESRDCDDSASHKAATAARGASMGLSQKVLISLLLIFSVGTAVAPNLGDSLMNMARTQRAQAAPCPGADGNNDAAMGAAAAALRSMPSRVDNTLPTATIAAVPPVVILIGAAQGSGTALLREVLHAALPGSRLFGESGELWMSQFASYRWSAAAVADDTGGFMISPVQLLEQQRLLLLPLHDTAEETGVDTGGEISAGSSVGAREDDLATLIGFEANAPPATDRELAAFIAYLRQLFPSARLLFVEGGDNVNQDTATGGEAATVRARMTALQRYSARHPDHVFHVCVLRLRVQGLRYARRLFHWLGIDWNEQAAARALLRLLGTA